MNLNAGDRIGYRGQTQYNEKYDEDGPDIMDNPQPLAHTTYNPRELELNVNGKSFIFDLEISFCVLFEIINERKLSWFWAYYETLCMIEIDLDDRLAETATEYGIRDITRSVFYGPGLGFDEPPGSDGPPDYDRQYTVNTHLKCHILKCVQNGAFIRIYNLFKL